MYKNTSSVNNIILASFNDFSFLRFLVFANLKANKNHDLAGSGCKTSPNFGEILRRMSENHEYSLHQLNGFPLVSI